MAHWIVVTDLDGTLLDHRYRFAAAEALIGRLEAAGIPVVPCSSKTAPEMRHFRRIAGLRSPFIVENGGAIHCQRTDLRWSPAGDHGCCDGELVDCLGLPAQSLLPSLAALSQDLALALEPLVEMSLDRVVALTGLAPQAASLALNRQWSVPFLPPANADVMALEQAAARRGLKVLQGNRFCHLIGSGCDKGLAVQRLRQRWLGGESRVLALGDSPNDSAMLDSADLAVVVPGADGPHPRLLPAIRAGRYRLAAAPHAEGWAAAVAEAIDS